MNRTVTIGFRRRHLPHWMVADASYFVTMRLKGSIPQSVLAELQAEYEQLNSPDCLPEELEERERLRFLKIDGILDSAKRGPKHLNIAPVADIVWSAFLWLEENRGWDIKALTIMSNHVHVLMRNLDGRNHCLNADLGILKGYTARQANAYLEHKGAFWMGENFDHWCRSDAQVIRAVRYIANNPVKAGLVGKWYEWPWTRVSQPFLADLSKR